MKTLALLTIALIAVGLGGQAFASTGGTSPFEWLPDTDVNTSYHPDWTKHSSEGISGDIFGPKSYSWSDSKVCGLHLCSDSPIGLSTTGTANGSFDGKYFIKGLF